MITLLETTAAGSMPLKFALFSKQKTKSKKREKR
jgi:hypothetical protein